MEGEKPEVFMTCVKNLLNDRVKESLESLEGNDQVRVCEALTGVCTKVYSCRAASV